MREALILLLVKWEEMTFSNGQNDLKHSTAILQQSNVKGHIFALPIRHKY